MCMFYGHRCSCVWRQSMCGESHLQSRSILLLETASFMDLEVYHFNLNWWLARSTTICFLIAVLGQQTEVKVSGFLYGFLGFYSGPYIWEFPLWTELSPQASTVFLLSKLIYKTQTTIISSLQQSDFNDWLKRLYYRIAE